MAQMPLFLFGVSGRTVNVRRCRSMMPPHYENPE